MGKKKHAIKRIETTDKKVSRKAARIRNNPAIKLAGAIGEIADQPQMVTLCVTTVVAGLVRRDARLMRAGARMLASHALATAIKAVVKRSVDRTRPALLVEEGRYETGKGRRNEGDFNSFPSGHTAGAIAVARALVREYPEYRGPAYAGAGAIAAIQLPRCSHFASDVAAGAVIGLAAEAAVDGLVAGYRFGRQALPSYSWRWSA